MIFAFSPVRNLCLLKTSKSGIPSARFKKNNALSGFSLQTCRHSVPGKAGKRLPPGELASCGGDRCAPRLRVASPVRGLPCSALPYFVLPKHRLLGRRTGHCGCERARSLPGRVYQHHPLPVFYLFSVSRVLPRRHVRHTKGYGVAPGPISSRGASFYTILFPPCRGRCYLKLSSNGSPTKILHGGGGVSGYTLRLCKMDNGELDIT